MQNLLGREPVQLDLKEISRYLKGKVVLVTGAGGSIGSELCRQVALVQPQKLVLLGHGENSIHQIWLELKQSFPSLELAIEIADVRDKEKLQLIFSQHRPNVVFHAAAHKHVPLMEMHPDEAIKTNVFGTKNVAALAHQSQCDIFIMVSTDKAVNPSSVMGATKGLAEIIVQNMFRDSHTVFAAVRFGNVLGSRGSVVPIFKEQIAQGGPVTITHPDMERYFMTIPEAVALVIQAGALAQGGEIFLLDMGRPVKIVELATKLIELSGLKVGQDIEIVYTGIRPGEKLYEELLTKEEGVTNTRHQRIFIAQPVLVDAVVLAKELANLSEHLIGPKESIFAVLKRVKQSKNKIYLASPHMSESGHEMHYIKEAFATNWIAPLGKNVNEFEKEVAAQVGVKSAAALSSGTAAIHLALKAVGVGAGDIVFCQSLTFAATANPIIYQNATPVFIDSDYQTWNISPLALEQALVKYERLGQKPKAVIVVHLYGLAADMDPIMQLCKKHHVPVIEDAAESLGTVYRGKQTGALGDYGVFSFNGNKIITTSGGGMLVSNDEEKIAKVKFWATQARDPARHYQHSELGFNYRMSNVLAGIGRGQLKVLEQRIEQKKKIFQFYRQALSGLEGVEMMPINQWNEPNYWLSCILLKGKVKPLELLEALEQENIESRPIWKPMHRQPFFADCDFIGTGVADDIFQQGLCLPSDTKLTEDDLRRIARIIKGLWQ